MPVQVQCCGLILMLILFYFYKSQKSIKLNTEKSFWNAFCMTLCCIILDIMSCVMIVKMDFFSILPVKFVCKTYLVSLVGVTFFALLYICTDVYTSKADYRKNMYRYLVFVLIAVVMIYAAPIEMYYDPDEQVLYSHGPSAMVTYLFALSTIIMLSVLLFRKRKLISKSRLQGVVTWLSVWIAAALIQFIYPKLLLVGFASALGMLVLYLKLENPGYNIDKQTGLFNNNAFMQYTKQLYDADIHFSVMSMIVERGCFNAIRSDLEEAVIAEAVQYLLSVPDIRVFRITSTEIMLVFSDGDKSCESIKKIRQRFGQPWGKNKGVMVSPYWIFTGDSSLTNDPADLLYLIRYARQNSKELADTRYFEIDEKFVSMRREEKKVEDLIADSLANDWVEVWYQPIYSTEQERFTSAEALIRIRTDDGTLYQPGNFIEIAERNGTIMQLGETVFEKVCCFLKDNDINSIGVDYIEVNLSVVQCAYSKLAEEYIKIMEKYQIPPELINLEITESASINAKKTLLRNMKKLMNYGVVFSLDDFGTGQSNLDYIVDMPVEIVKFDKGMINAYFENVKARYIMDAAMGMIQGMNLKIVSEGIESEDQFKTMQDLGINYIQGYYFSKPLPADEFVKFISEAHSKAANTNLSR